MDLEQAIQFINQLSLEKKGKRLKMAHEISIRAAWEDIDYKDAIELYSTGKSPTIKYVSSGAGKYVWDLLSDVLGGKFSKKNLRQALLELENKGNISVGPSTQFNKNTESDVKTTSKKQSVHNFYGYQEELRLGIDALQDRWSLILTGAPGVGKSAFISQLVTELNSNNNPFDNIFRKSFDYLPSISDLISEWCQYLNIAEASATSMIQYFSSHHCLIVLDQAEQLLGSNVTQLYEDYIVFLKRFINEQNLSSFVIGSVKPLNELIDFQGFGHPVQLVALRGLDKDAARALLSDYGLEDQSRWDFVIEKYRGNPQALTKVARLCRDFFGGSVELYLEKQSTLIGASFINSLNNLLSIDDPLVDLQIKILRYFYESCHTDDGISINKTIKEVINLKYTDSTSDILEALNALVHQSFIEKFDVEKVAHFRLPPMIRKYVQVNPNGLFSAA